MARDTAALGERPLYWVGSSRKDLPTFPEIVKDHLGVALSVAQFGGKHPDAKPWKGEGADEILGGYAHLRRDMLLYNREGQDPDAIKELLAWLDEHNTGSRGLLLPDGEVGPLESVRRVLGFVPSWIETFSTRAVKLRPLLARGFQERFGPLEGIYGILDDVDVRGQLQGRDALHQSLYLWSKTVMANYILTMLGDRMEMAHSIEGRVPFLDHKLVELIASLPVNQKIRGMTEKYVLREAVRDRITDTV